MRAIPRAIMCAAALVLTAGQLQAGTVLVSQGAGTNGYGYGFAQWDHFTAALNTATGNQVTVAPDFSNVVQILGFDALLLDQRWTSGNLSATEINNLTAFIATGRRVLMIGENNAWFTWNSQILEIVGANYTGFNLTGTATALVSNELTNMAGSVDLTGAGDAGSPVGGTALYDKNFATLWGANGNVLTVLDINVWQDDQSTQNLQFGTNVANWLASNPVPAVPEPTSLALLGIGAAALMTLRVVRRRRAAKNFTSAV